MPWPVTCAVTLCLSQPPAKHSRRGACVWAFCPNSKLNLQFFSFGYYELRKPECKAENASIVHAAQKGSLEAWMAWDKGVVWSPCPPPAPQPFQFLQCRKKIVLQSLLFHPSPQPPPSWVLESAAFYSGQIVATLSGACWTRGTAEITGRCNGSPALTPRAQPHSPRLFKYAFWEFPKMYPVKGPSPTPDPGEWGRENPVYPSAAQQKLCLELARGLSPVMGHPLKAMGHLLQGTQTAGWDFRLPQTGPGFTTVSLQPPNSDMHGSKYRVTVCIDARTHTYKLWSWL